MPGEWPKKKKNRQKKKKKERKKMDTREKMGQKGPDIDNKNFNDEIILGVKFYYIKPQRSQADW